MDFPPLLDAVATRIAPGVPAGDLWLWAALVLAALLVSVPPLWRVVRPAITIAHELGHAGVGVLVGRRFTGFVVRGDMSGHAVTVGPARGVGRILTLWAGYPAPGLLGAGLIDLALQGWAGAALLIALMALLVSLVFARSVHTLLVVLVAVVVLGVTWWWGTPTVVAALTLGAGALLLLGAWRHLGGVMGSRRRGEDPAQLASLTGVPAALWNLSFILVLGACTAAAAFALLR